MSALPRGVAAKGVTRIGRGAAATSGEDRVAIEEPLEIRVCSEPLAITMRTPGEDARLAVGFLFAEGIVRSADDLGTLAHCGRPGEEGYGNVLDVIPAPGVHWDVEKVKAARRGTLTTAACGVCGRQSVDDLLSACGRLPSGPAVPLEVLRAATGKLRGAQRNFAETGGTHAAAALGARGEVLFAFEDVGRHNAVDKVVGALVLSRALARANPLGARGEPPEGTAPAILAVSGRASFEIVQKAAMAQIPVVASVSAASSLAIELAERAGIALAAFVRGEGLNLYTHPSRVDVR